MTKLEMTAIKDKETKNFDRYSYGQIVNGEEEVMGNAYVPKNASHVKVTLEYELP